MIAMDLDDGIQHVVHGALPLRGQRLHHPLDFRRTGGNPHADIEGAVLREQRGERLEVSGLAIDDIGFIGVLVPEGLDVLDVLKPQELRFYCCRVRH